MNLAQRIANEKRITKLLLKSITDNGYKIRMFDSEEHYHDMTNKEALDLAMDLDECMIYATRDGKSVACFYMVYGNDGYDCLCDHSCDDVSEVILKPVEDLIEKLEMAYV